MKIKVIIMLAAVLTACLVAACTNALQFGHQTGKQGNVTQELGKIPISIAKD